MIRINLLPHREAKRKLKQTAFVVLLALGGILGVAVVLVVSGYNASMISIQSERNLVLKTANTELDVKIKSIADLKAEIEALKARQQAVEDLQGDRNQPVYLLDELVKNTPAGVYLKGFKQDGQRVVVNGVAQSQERVAELLRNLSGASSWLEKPELTEVRAATLAQSKTGKKVVEFTLSVLIRRQRDKDAAAAAAALAAKTADAAAKPAAPAVVTVPAAAGSTP
jgi:type IV pilus assembly protein PilN